MTKYIGWLPKDKNDWDDLCFASSSEIRNTELTIVNPEKTEEIKLIIDVIIIKEAFPWHIYLEDRTKKWYRFCIVSTKEDSDTKFIIPLH